MGFSDWAKEQLHSALPKCYLVENRDLNSSSSGLRYRRFPSHSDDAKVTRLKPVPWDSLVCGTLEADGAFLKLEDGYYLPVFTREGVRVLQELDREEAEEEDLAGPKKKAQDIVVPEGPGAWYEVVAERVALRTGPSLGAKALGQIRRGQHVELFGWDATGLWRECLDHRLSRSGFVLLDHADLGPLLRPRGEPLCIRPLNVIAVAAEEGRFDDLERFLAEAGTDHLNLQDPRGPAVVLAARKGQFRCCLRLLRAGATEGNSPELSALRRCDPEELRDLEAKSEDELRLWLHRARRQEPEEAPEAPRAVEPEPRKEVMKKKEEEGGLYEVAFDSVWIRREPDSGAARVSKRIKGQRVRILEFDASGLWGRTEFKTSDGMDEGWMLLSHGEFGDLLRLVEDDGQGFVVRPQ